MGLHAPRRLTTRPTVSVVIPCYNYGRYLPEAVAAALGQDGVDVDVLIVDDCSTDGSAEVAQDLAAADPRVDVLVHETNRGHIATYNDGLAKATGDYVTLVSADDLVAPDALSRAVALMESFPRVGMVYGFPESFDVRAPSTSRARARSWSVWAGHAWLSKVLSTGENPIMSPEVVLRRAAWLEVGGYDPRLPHSADLAAWLDVALRWDVGRVNGPAQAYYRVHGANMHLNTYAGWVTDLEHRKHTFDLLLAEGRPLPSDAHELRARVHRALAREALRRAETAPEGDRAALVRLARTMASDESLVPRGQMRRRLAAPWDRVRTSASWHRWKRFG